MRPNDSGFQTLELTVLFPVILLLLALVVVAQRGASAQTRVHAAARHAARGASLEGASGSGATRAKAIVSDMIAADKGCIGGPETVTETITIGPIPAIRVQVSCRADFSGLGLGTKTVTAQADEPLDTLAASLPFDITRP